MLLARLDTPFGLRLQQAFAEVAATLDRSVVVHGSVLDRCGSTAVRPARARQRCGRADPVMPGAPRHLGAVAGAAARGLPLICPITDLPTTLRMAYVGIDHTRAWRTMALIAAMAAGHPGSALVLASCLGYRGYA